MMNHHDYIQIDIICENYQLRKELLYEFYEFGFVHIHSSDPNEYLHKEEIGKLEKLLNLHRNLEINLPGVEVIMGLLEKLENLQAELSATKKQLEIYNKVV